MYPELFRIPFIDYPISTFGVAMAVAFLVAFWITMKGMEEKRIPTGELSAVFIYVLLGGIVGSKLYYAIDNWLLDGGPFLPLLLSRGGITWYGGLIGGTLAGAIGAKRVGINVKQLADCAAPATAVGQAIGRIGCFLVGDDYGRASDVPWAVAFPEGAPPTFDHVHPTQLYEVAWLLPVALFLWSRRRRSPFLFGEYMVLNGAGRIVIENWRVNPTVALGMTEPQWIGVGLIALGASGWIYFKHRPPQAN
ncbi:MAG: prolipoprotein diacylglyceryl transferase [Myxococcota bacterium]